MGIERGPHLASLNLLVLLRNRFDSLFFKPIKDALTHLAVR